MKGALTARVDSHAENAGESISGRLAGELLGNRISTNTSTWVREPCTTYKLNQLRPAVIRPIPAGLIQIFSISRPHQRLGDGRDVALIRPVPPGQIEPFRISGGDQRLGDSRHIATIMPIPASVIRDSASSVLISTPAIAEVYCSSGQYLPALYNSSALMLSISTIIIVYYNNARIDSRSPVQLLLAWACNMAYQINIRASRGRHPACLIAVSPADPSAKQNVPRNTPAEMAQQAGKERGTAESDGKSWIVPRG